MALHVLCSTKSWYSSGFGFSKKKNSRPIYFHQIAYIDNPVRFAPIGTTWCLGHGGVGFLAKPNYHSNLSEYRI